MSRLFAGQGGSDQQIILAPGNVSTDGGPITLLVLWRPGGSTGDSWDSTVLAAGDTGSDLWGLFAGSDEAYVHFGGPSLAAGVVLGEWQVIGFTKATGTATVRFHHRDSGGWAHSDAGTAGDAAAAAQIWIGNGHDSISGFGSLRMRGEWVCAAVWNTVLSDGQVEAAGSLTALQAWADAAPDGLWDGNQSGTSDPVVDRTGGGADEISAPSTGSPPTTGAADPPGWSYTISSGITGTLAVTEAHDTLAAAGTSTPPPITGTLAVQEADDTLAASGTHTAPSFTGTLAVTEASDTLAAVGTVVNEGIAGNLAVTEADDTLSAAGTFTALAGALDVTVLVGPTRTGSVTAAATRERELATAGDTRSSWDVGDTRSGWTVGATRSDREE